MKMMKKILFILICLLLATNSISADIGPKPSTNIEVSLDAEKTYYVTVLAFEETSGPNTALTSETATDKIDSKFVEYATQDGTYYWGLKQEIKGSGEFNFTYYPPEEFKILIYCVEDDSFYVSDTLERYNFDSNYYVMLDGDSLNITTDGFDYFEIFKIAIRIVLTIVIELLVALGFRFLNKKTYLDVILVNVITQVLLNIALYFAYHISGYAGIYLMIIYFIIEAGIIIFESIYYMIRFKKFGYSKGKCFTFSFFANLISYLTGEILWLFF